MESLAQMERELIVERTRAGLEAPDAKDAWGGRKRRMTEGKVQAAKKLLAGGAPPPEGGGRELRGIGADLVPLGTGLFTAVEERASEARP